MDFRVPTLIVNSSNTAQAVTGTHVSALTSGKIGVFKNDYTADTGVTPSASPYIILAQGTGDASLGSIKSPKIFPRNVTKWYGVAAVTSNTQQITYVGYDEVNDCKTMEVSCENMYRITVRVFSHYLRALFPEGMTRTFVINGGCCGPCASDCTALDCKIFADAVVAAMQADSYFTKYIESEVVSKCDTVADNMFALVLPDPGDEKGNITDFTYATSAAGLTPGTNTAVAQSSTSGTGTGSTWTIVVGGGGTVTSVTNVNDGASFEIGDTVTIAGTSLTGGATPADDVVITITGTDSEEGLLLTEIREKYADLVADAETDIVFSADADSTDGSATSTGNVMIEITAESGVTVEDFEPYNGVYVTVLPCPTVENEGCVCGVKLTGKVLDEFGNTCVPQATPHYFDMVKFSVFAEKAPITSNDKEVYSACTAWDVTTTQSATYKLGSGEEYRDMELEMFSNYNIDKVHFLSPIFNGLHTLFVDTTKDYDMYYLSGYVDKNSAFSSIDKQEFEVYVLWEHADPTPANQTAFETTINTFLSGYFPAVTL
jgi:hypothetical protein